MTLKEMKADMIAAGIYTKEDIEEIYRLESEYAAECEKIATECAEEGYPSHGSNYDLRCENLRKYYDEQINLINLNYEDD